MKQNLTNKIKPIKYITFYSLLEKHNSDIKKATEQELARVKPNGLKNLFKAWRVYDEMNGRKNENAPLKKVR